MNPALKPILAAGASALAACTPTEPAAAPPQNDAAVAGTPRAQVLIASNRGRTTLSPAAITLGRFAAEQGCLRFVTAEGSYLAVFGAGGPPVLTGDGFLYSGRRVILGKDYQIGGGPRSLEPGAFEIEPMIERTCPGPYFQIGPIVKG